jgi:hypothetical protein
LRTTDHGQLTTDDPPFPRVHFELSRIIHDALSVACRRACGCFARETPTPVCIEAIASAGTRRTPPSNAPLRPPEPNNRTRLEVQVTWIRIGDELQLALGNALVLVQGDLLGVHAGDRLQIFGRNSAPSPAGNPGEQDLAELARQRRRRMSESRMKADGRRTGGTMKAEE